VTKLLSDIRFRLVACVVALGAVAGVGVVTHAPAPAAQAQGTERATRTVVNRAALSTRSRRFCPTGLRRLPVTAPR
jgi:hypothetical protein